MARLRDTESVEGDDHSTFHQNSPPARSRRLSNPGGSHDASPSPSPSASSDKENPGRANSKGNMGPPPLPYPQSSTSHAAKRRRLDGALQDQSSASRASTEDIESQCFDPNQDVEERRKVRKGLRDLNKEAADQRTEWMASSSNGLRDAVERANSIFQSVKQTSDATIDSRLLVTAGDLTYKKTQQVSVGDGSQGIDVDEFVSKCISFMRRGDERDGDPSNTQRRRRHAPTEADSDGEDEESGREIGDGLNWEYLGSHACFPANSRPPVPGFLLGPLSVQKRGRVQTQRRQRTRIDPEDAVRPQELRATDLQQQENSNLTRTCMGIHKRLARIQKDGESQVEEEMEDDADDSRFEELCEKYNLLNDGGVSLLKYVVNPKSFGQTVENLFYVSFLIKDGLVGVQTDSKGMASLHSSDESQKRPAQRHQAVFSMDFETWQEMIDVFNMQGSESLIEHRAEEQGPSLASTGWYG